MLLSKRYKISRTQTCIIDMYHIFLACFWGTQKLLTKLHIFVKLWVIPFIKEINMCPTRLVMSLSIFVFLTIGLVVTCAREDGPGWSTTWKALLWTRLHNSEHAHRMVKRLFVLVDPDHESNFEELGTIGLHTIAFIWLCCTLLNISPGSQC